MAEDVPGVADDQLEAPIFADNPTPSKAEIYHALVEFSGNVAAVSRSFGCRRSKIAMIIDTTPELVALKAEFYEEAVDASEDNIFADVKKGDQSASRFVLGTLGKKRGWAQGVEGTGKDGAMTVTIMKFTEEPQSG